MRHREWAKQSQNAGLWQVMLVLSLLALALAKAVIESDRRNGESVTTPCSDATAHGDYGLCPLPCQTTTQNRRVQVVIIRGSTGSADDSQKLASRLRCLRRMAMASSEASLICKDLYATDPCRSARAYVPPQWTLWHCAIPTGMPCHVTPPPSPSTAPVHALWAAKLSVFLTGI